MVRRTTGSALKVRPVVMVVVMVVEIVKMMLMLQERETVTRMISAPACWSAGQTTAPPRLGDIGTRETTAVRRNVPETDSAVPTKVPAPPTPTV